MIRINCSIDCLNAVWHAVNYMLSAHVTHAVGDILTAILTQCFKGYFECACGVFAHIPLSGCDYRASPLICDARENSGRQLLRGLMRAVNSQPVTH